MIPKKYRAMGFYITRFGAHSLVLKRYDKAVFVFRSVSEINEDLIRVLCECNLKVFGTKKNSRELVGSLH